MQDRYAGDVGDFGKFGMLRCMEKAGLNVGVNWYLVGNETHNNDGKHLGYLHDTKFMGCDNELLALLERMILKQQRTVLELEALTMLKSGQYYHERLTEPKQPKDTTRRTWHENGLHSLNGCELVFLDPDNGMLPPSVGRGSNKSIKYVFPEEIVDYYRNGHSVVFYSHRTREQLDVYLKRFEILFGMPELKHASIRGLSFKRGTIRDYFFIVHPEHWNAVEAGVEMLMGGNWSKHFDTIIL